MFKKNNISKIAVITGASSGIGYAIAKYLSSKYYIVYSLSRKAKDDDNIRYLECDITNYNQVEECLEQIYGQHKQIDLVINNSGFGITSSIEELNIDQYEEMINVNVLAALNLCLYAMKYLKHSQGKIINIGSIASEIISLFGTHYSISKRLLKLITYCLHSECSFWKIGICNLIVGKTHSDFEKNRIINDDPNSDYLKDLNNYLNNLSSSTKYWMQPIKVAKTIYKLDRKRKIPHSKTIGFKNKLLVLFFKIIPINLAIKINYNFFCKSK